MAERFARFTSLRFRFTLLLVLFGGALLLAVLLPLEQNLRSSLMGEHIEKELGIARCIAFTVEGPQLGGNDALLHSALKNALREGGVEYALVVGRHGYIRAAADGSRVGQIFSLPAGARPLEGAEDYPVRRLGGNAGIFDLEMPIYPTAGNAPRLGAIHLGLSAAPVAAEIEALHRHLGMLAGVALALGSIAAYLLAGWFVRPMQELVRGLKEIGSDNVARSIGNRRSDELGQLTDAVDAMTSSLREKTFSKDTFEHKAGKSLAETIPGRENNLQLGGEEMEVTILFCDIRRFTSLAERLPAAQVVELLNDYFTRMIQVVLDHQGLVDKLMGDSVMALFGAPSSLGDDPLRAVRCAVEMQQAVQHFNGQRASRDLPPLEMGIGINTGPVIAGNIGSTRRMEYTVIGDSVNIAARLQGLARPGEILVSEATYRTIAEMVIAEPLAPTELKGKRLPVAIYRIDSLTPAADRPSNYTPKGITT